jgi:alcohol dehydrogenase (cytochrome c)
LVDYDVQTWDGSQWVMVPGGEIRGNALALRTRDGETLWHTAIGGVFNGPVTYELDGQQYVLLGGGGALFAFALPERR